jgi:hypothetical protein
MKFFSTKLVCNWLIIKFATEKINEMKAVSIELNKSQFLKVINQLDENDKLELYNELKKSLFLKRFNKLLKSTKTEKLSMEDITNEVESVRKQRYEEGRQVI